jgi:uncharacterized protein involved in outer membrane biogenesis
VSRKRAVIVILGLLGAAVALGGIAIVVLVTVDLRPLVEKYASRSLDRRLAIGALRVGWGNPLTVELHDLRLANAAWGSRPDMIQIESMSAEIEAWSLLGGVLRFRKLDIVKPAIVLERDTDGTGNWRFGARSLSSSGVAVVPKNRVQFPTLIDFRLRDGAMSYRTSSGAVLRLDAHEATIRADGEDRPVTLALDGDYNGAPGQLHAEMQSFVALRNASVPFGIAFSFSARSSTVEFEGTLTEPLDLDGAQGTLKLEGRDLGAFLKMLGSDAAADFPFSVAGTLQRTGDHWQLTDAKGKLAASAFTGTLALQEAGRGKPDDLTLALDFAQLDLRQLLGGGGKAAATGADDFGTFPLRVDDQRGTNVDASIKAKQLDYGAMRLADVAVRTTLTSGQIAVKRIAFVFAGGTVDASGTASTVPAGSRIAATAEFSGLDAGRVSEMLGADAGQFAGKAEGGAALEMSGQTVRQALKASRGSAVLGMTEGSVSRALLERAATDLRSFFRKGEGSAPIKCLLGIIDLRNGLGKVSLLRLQTNEAILIGGGQLDLLRDRLDLTVKSESSSTSFLALDVPFRVSGDFTALSVRPAIGVSTAWLDALARTNSARELPPNLLQLAGRNPCLR